MKTVKLVMIATLLTFTAVSIANAGSTGKMNDINISFEKAIQNPGLVVAMHQQLNGDFLSSDKTVYNVNVVYQNIIFRITGSRAQWEIFFNWRLDKRILYRQKDIK